MLLQLLIDVLNYFLLDIGTDESRKFIRGSETYLI